MKTAPIVLAVTLIALLAVSNPLARAQMPFTTIALSDKPAPGVADGARFHQMDAIFTSSGQLAIRAELAGPGIDRTNDFGLWVGSPGSLQLLAREGDPAPGLPGVNYGQFYVTNPFMNGAGQVAFASALTGPNVGDGWGAVWTGTPADLRILARRGDPAPGLEPGVRFEYSLASSHSTRISDSGQIIFYSELSGPSISFYNSRSLWTTESGPPRIFARDGFTIPGSTNDLICWSFASPAQNRAGQLAFRATIGPPNDWAKATYVLLTGSPFSLKIALRFGDPAPGAPGAVFGSGFSSTPGGIAAPGLNNVGQIAFLSNIEGPDIDDSNDDGIWAGSPGNLRLVARSGSPAPGTNTRFAGDERHFDDYPTFWPPVLADNGHVAFIAQLTNAQGQPVRDWGVWAGAPGNLSLIARSADPAPGTRGLFAGGPDVPDGTYDDYPNGKASPFYFLTINPCGQVAFLGEVADAVGLFATDPQGHLQLIALQHALFQVAPGDYRTIEAIDFYGGYGPDAGLIFDAAGRLLFSATFSDGSTGLFLATIPEPATPIALALISLAMLRPSRAHRLQEKHP